MNSNIDFVTRAHALWRVRMARWQQRFRFFSTITLGAAATGAIIAPQFLLHGPAITTALQYAWANVLTLLGSLTGTQRDERLHDQPPGVGGHYLLSIGFVEIAAFVEGQVFEIILQPVITERLADVAKSQHKDLQRGYRIGGAQKKLCIGSYPDISLKQARDAAYEARRAVASGGDPAFEKRKRKIRAEFLSAQTFEAVAREYIEQMMVQNGRADGTIVKANYFLDKLAPAIGNRPINEIEPFEVLAPLKRLEATGKHETAKKCRSFAGRVFRYGVATTRCKSDPTSMLNVWARAIEGASVTVWHVFEFPSIGRLRSQAPNWPHAVSLQCPARASSLRTRVEHEFCPWPCGPSVGATSHQTRKEIIMARSNTAPAQETNPPEFLAWHVANKGDKGFWTRIGAAWFHRDRKGLSLQLEVVPINGRIVLRTPLDDEKKEPGA